MLVPAEGGAPQQGEFSATGREEPALVHSPGAEHLLEQPQDEAPPGFGEAPQSPCPPPHTLPIQAIFQLIPKSHPGHAAKLCPRVPLIPCPASVQLSPDTDTKAINVVLMPLSHGHPSEVLCCPRASSLWNGGCVNTLEHIPGCPLCQPRLRQLWQPAVMRPRSVND